MLPFYEEIRKVPLLWIVIPLFSGIIFQEYFPLHKDWVIISSIFIFILLIILKSSSSFFSILIVIFSLNLGQLKTAFIQNKEQAKPDFYNAQAYIATIIDNPAFNKNKFSFLAETEAYKTGNNWKTCKVACQIFVRDSVHVYKAGNRLLIKAHIQKISADHNFYSKYLHYQGIDNLFFAKAKDIGFLDERFNWKAQIACFRQLILDKISQASFEKRERAVLGSLVLGFKGELDADLKQAYAQAGVAHVLSVSGMHVGIVYVFLLFLFSLLNRSAGTRFLKTILIILGLWIYAFLSGYSPPVLRSAIMFSFFAFAELGTRKSSNMNILLASAIVLLLWNPYFLFDAGFQLSYAAMAGIFLFYVPISDKWKPKNSFVGKIYLLVLVSVAAQLGTLALSLYYFQQFPTYFILSNLIIIPLSGFILYGGLVYIILLPVSVLSSFVMYPLNWLLESLNFLILHIETLPANVIQVNHFTIFDAISLALIILLFIFFFVRQKIEVFVPIMLILVLVSVFANIDFFKQENATHLKLGFFKKEPQLIVSHGEEKLIFYHKSIKAESKLPKIEEICFKENNLFYCVSTSEVNILMIKDENEKCNFKKILILNKEFKLIQKIEVNKAKAFEAEF